jgi:hypothetical protein
MRWLDAPARRERVARTMAELASGDAAERIVHEVLQPSSHQALR